MRRALSSLSRYLLLSMALSRDVSASASAEVLAAASPGALGARAAAVTGAESESSSGSRRLPAVFAGHGGSMWTMTDVDPTAKWARRYGAKVRAWAPKAVLVISGHYETSPVAVSAVDRWETLHDHPAENLYDFTYPAPTSREVSKRVSALLSRAGIEHREDRRAQLDHGAWIPLALLLPDADVPVVTLSLEASGSPAVHAAIGRAIAPLRDEGVLILGSGGVTHNLRDAFGLVRSRPSRHRGFFRTPDEYAMALKYNEEFNDAVAVAGTTLVGEARTRRLGELLVSPLGRQNHPSPDHFLPLVVTAAAGLEEPGRRPHTGFQYGVSMDWYVFGDEPSEVRADATDTDSESGGGGGGSGSGSGSSGSGEL